ncbi:fasciclin domain-containing protein [Echinicola vietnamensis]|uniref:Secreted/surface protein with fasciclin-like repeats n=1 Tax=Echinicola vietnamensis (strain DSM 17526 / LMG 23754 / KMM 6221) TaxID=926556 RepID=L0FX83_ECHVK|nr:fasciclin domain-containing protein [Echinicola vietnamensis]AGA77917.1 secreted/surface protein with fasciclin-like repeats [Echinicola vietnamensis DSM 17526]
MNTFKINTLWRIRSSMVLLVVLCLAAIGCEFDPPSNINVTEDTNISGYLRQHPDEFSNLSRILEISNTEGFLGTYGTYTFFAPNNEAVDGYLEENGLSLDGLGEEEAKDIVRFHLLTDTLSTADFTDGKLSVPTEYGKYLVTGAEFADGETYTRVNRQANIIQSNIKLGNGFIHAIDNVLSPPTKTVAQWLEENQRFSIFSQVLKETGWYDSLDREEEGQWYTVLAESDEALSAAGYESFEAMKEHYSQTGDPTNPSDSLNLYVAYHVIPDIKFIADLLTATAHPTEAPQEVVTIKLDGTDVLVNDDTFFGVHEPGSPIIRAQSDNSVTNGVVHSVEDHFAIKLRAPTAVYWDVAEQPEIRQLTQFFRVPGAPNYTFKLGELSRMTWEGNYVDAMVNYFPPSLNQVYYAFGDYLRIELQANRLTAAEIKTPTLVKGRYKLWICHHGDKWNNGCELKVTFNGEDIPGARLLDTTIKAPTDMNEDELESRGWKEYLTAGSDGGKIMGRFIGTIEVPTTGEHTLRFDRVTGIGRSNGGLWLDMIHFIPEDQDQIYPKFALDGSPVYEGEE